MPGDKHAALRTRRHHQALLAAADPVVRSTDDRDVLRQAILDEFAQQLDLALAELPDGDTLLTFWEFHRLTDHGAFVGSHAARREPAARAWRRAVLDRDGHACTRCAATTALHAHHLLEWATHPEHRYDLANGVTLCRSCHRDAHRG